MKKLKLEELNLGNAEVLSREELKKVFGGMGSGAGGGSGNCGECGGGDHLPWKTGCVVTRFTPGGSEFCSCPNSNASWNDC